MPRIEDDGIPVPVKGPEATRLKKIAKGICTSCDSPAVNGRRKCSQCLENARERCGVSHYKRYRDFWLSQGLCARCGKEPHEMGKTQCRTCAHRRRKTVRAIGGGPLQDLTGTIAGSWLVDRLIGKASLGNFLWLVRCTNCGKEKELLTSNVRATKCPHCQHRQKGETGLSTLYSHYRKGASGRNLPFDLTIEEFRSLTSKECYYCGSPPSNVKTTDTEWGAYTYSGIDRVDNEDGYRVGNCVSCCEICNRAKLTMSQEQFLLHIACIIRCFKNGTLPCLPHLPSSLGILSK